MAEFSKQYIEKFEPEWSFDFDIFEIWNKLEENTYEPIICEGFGFFGICKKENVDEPILIFTFSRAISLKLWNEKIPDNCNENDGVFINFSELEKIENI